MSRSHGRVPSERQTPGMISTDLKSADRSDARRTAGKGPGSAPARQPRPGAKAAEIRRISDLRPAPTRRQVAQNDYYPGDRGRDREGCGDAPSDRAWRSAPRSGRRTPGGEGMWVDEWSVVAERGEGLNPSFRRVWQLQPGATTVSLEDWRSRAPALIRVARSDATERFEAKACVKCARQASLDTPRLALAYRRRSGSGG